MLMHFIKPNAKALPDSLLHTIWKSVQSHKNSHPILLLVLLVNTFQFLQIYAIVPNVSMILFKQSWKLFVTIEHVSSRLFFQDLVEVRIFGPPSCPIFTYPSSNIKDFCQCSLYIFFEETILLPWVEGPYNILLFGPCLKVFYNPINYICILFITPF